MLGHSCLAQSLFKRKSKLKKMEAPQYMETSFDLAGGLIFIQNSQQEAEQETYLLDTGAPTLILNQVPAGKSSGSKVVSLGGSTWIANKKVKDFQMKDMKLGNIASYVTDLSHLEKVKRRTIDGILGYKVFQAMELFIDYQNRYLTIFEPGASDLHSLVKPLETIKFIRKGHFPIVKVKIGKHNYYFGIDTGAEVNVMDSRWCRRMHRKHAKGWKKKNIQGINKGTVKVESCQIPNIELGNREFNDMEFVFTDLTELNNCLGFELDGILGFPFLSAGKFSLNYKKKRLFLWDDPLREVEEAGVLTAAEGE